MSGRGVYQVYTTLAFKLTYPEKAALKGKNTVWMWDF